jgi:hypothetical protein
MGKVVLRNFVLMPSNIGHNRVFKLFLLTILLINVTLANHPILFVNFIVKDKQYNPIGLFDSDEEKNSNIGRVIGC